MAGNIPALGGPGSFDQPKKVSAFGRNPDPLSTGSSLRLADKRNKGGCYFLFKSTANAFKWDSLRTRLVNPLIINSFISNFASL